MKGCIGWITYYFPPISLGGIERNYELTKYLKEDGWDIEVYTQKPSNYIISENEDVVKVNRIFSLDPFHIPFSRIKSGGGKRDFISFPDNKIGFLPFLFKNIKKKDIFITSSPPISLHLAGLYLKNKGYKWIAEFRDPYIDGPLGEYLFGFQNSLAKTLERIIIEKSDMVITTTGGLTEIFKKRYKNNKIFTITNGFNEADFNTKPVKNDKFVLTYLGTLNKTHRPDAIINGLKLLEKNMKNLKNIFQFKVIGYVLEEYLNELKKFEFFKYEGYLPRKEGIRKMLSSNMLLLILTEEESRFAVPGKTYNYLRSNIPIFLVSGKGYLRNFLDGYAIFSNHNPKEIAGILEKIIKGGIRLKSFPNIENYEWRNISEHYSLLISKCVKN